MKLSRKINNKPLKPGETLLEDKKSSRRFDRHLAYTILIGAVLILSLIHI